MEYSAETSITIDGIRFIVDSGMWRQLRHVGYLLIRLYR